MFSGTFLPWWWLRHKLVFFGILAFMFDVFLLILADFSAVYRRSLRGWGPWGHICYSLQCALWVCSAVGCNHGSENTLDRSWGGGSQPRRAAQDRVYIVVSHVWGHCILMLRASLGKVVHTVKRAGTYAAKVSPQELHKIAVHVRAVVVTA
jgi:hypothetical protein